MNNPFVYTKLVTGASFCNRKKEQEQLQNYILSSQNVLLYSHRRKGKSSLIKQVFDNIKNNNLDIGTVYIDLYATTSERDFIQRTFQQINSLETNTDKFIKILKKSINTFSLSFGVDPNTNMPTVSPSFEGVREETVLKNLMDIINGFSKKRKIVIAFDEFQAIANYSNSDVFEKSLRSYIQEQSNVCYIFSGSQQHLLTEMFRSQKRAFYQQAASFPLEEIKTEHYILWMDTMFKKGGFDLNKKDLEQIVIKFKNHPMYVQLFCYYLWEEIKDNSWSDQTINKIEQRMIEQKHPEYQVLWDTLSSNQKKVLKLVFFNKGKNLFSAKSLQSVDVKTASAVTRSLNGLSDKEILKKNGGYSFQDIIFESWMKKNV